MGGSMSSVIISGDTSGSITLAAPAVAGTNTITLPANTGTVITTASSAVVTQAMLGTNVVGVGPTFSAYKASTTSLTTSTQTKATFTTEAFDTNSNYDTTNSRFTPTVAGYYLINTGADIYGAAMTQAGIAIYKNGAIYHRQDNQTVNTDYQCNLSGIIYCNGSTDYIEIYVNAAGTSLNLYGNNTTQWTWFSGSLLRAA